MKLSSIVCAIFLLAQMAFGHAPFDCTARVLVHPGSVEVIITAGAGLADQFLAGSTMDARRLGAVGRPAPLPTDLAAKLFEINADGRKLSPQSADVVTDGQEFQFGMVYPLAFAKSLALRPLYLDLLNPPKVSALVVTDENGNMIGSAMLSPGHERAEFNLPANLFAASANPTTQSLPPIVATNAVAEKAAPPAPQRPAFAEFLKLGIGHILTGYDHLLFLTALLLGCRSLKPMLLVITGFTLAHSLTLALAALNLVTISSRIVEPAIAASIIFVAAENFRRGEKAWHRCALTGGFGLIHGFGFANALRESGLAGPGAEIAMPLFAFNLGVEIGQLAVAAAVLPGLFALRKWPRFERGGARVISALVILVAAFWFWRRVTSIGD